MKDLFRKEALESFSSNSNLTKSIHSVSIKTTVFVILIVACTAVFTIWLFFGTIYETVSVNGIVWPTKTGGTVYAPSGGMVTKVMVSLGDTVKAGDILAVIVQEDILSEIEAAKASGADDSEIQSLYDKYRGAAMIRSKVDGIVTRITDENVYIPDNGIAAQVVPYDKSGNNDIVTAFISSEKGGLIKLGMEVQVMPDFAPREEYGYIKAYVSEISQYPVTGQHIKDTGGELFLSTLDERESYLQIEITLMPDSESKSHLKWSNPESGDIAAPMGTMCEADIVIKKCRPYEWLF